MKTENETNSSRCRSIFSLDPYWYCECHQESWRIWTFFEAKNSFHCPVVTCSQPEPHPQAPWKVVVSGCLAKEPDVGAPAPVPHWDPKKKTSWTARYSHPAGRLIDLNPTKALCAWAGWAGSWGRWVLIPLERILKPALRGRSIFPSFFGGEYQRDCLNDKLTPPTTWLEGRWSTMILLVLEVKRRGYTHIDRDTV